MCCVSNEALFFQLYSHTSYFCFQVLDHPLLILKNNIKTVRKDFFTNPCWMTYPHYFHAFVCKVFSDVVDCCVARSREKNLFAPVRSLENVNVRLKKIVVTISIYLTNDLNKSCGFPSSRRPMNHS